MKRHTATIVVSTILGLAIIAGCESMYSHEQGLDSGKTASFFEAIQIDPRAEDSAGPQFVATGDFDNDGRMDLVSAWNESQPIQIHLQQQSAEGEIYFLSIPIGGTTPIAVASGLHVDDMDQDGFDDIVVLVKDTGLVAECDPEREDCDPTDNGGYIEGALAGTIVIFFNPQDVLNSPWEGIELNQASLAGTEEGELPEEGGYSSLDVADIDGVDGPDIIATLNSPEGNPPADPPNNTVNFFPNPGGSTARKPEVWSRIAIHADLPAVGDCRATDVDDDGDIDIVVTYPTAKNSNVRWLPNPLSLGQMGNVYAEWPYYAPIGHIATEADVIDLGDIDGDGIEDILVRSSSGKVVQWFKRPESPSLTYIRNPWQTYTIAEFVQREPGAIALGDLDGDGTMDAAIAAQGAVAWFSPYYPDEESSVFDLWKENIIIDDRESSTAVEVDGSGAVTVVTDPNASAEATSADTLINTLIIADIDNDGYNDIIATLDRTSMSGLSNDALALFRNTLGDDD